MENHIIAHAARIKTAYEDVDGYKSYLIGNNLSRETPFELKKHAFYNHLLDLQLGNDYTLKQAVHDELAKEEPYSNLIIGEGKPPLDDLYDKSNEHYSQH